MLNASLRRARASGSISTAAISFAAKPCFSIPPINAVAMLPPPINVTFTSVLSSSCSKNRGTHAHHGAAGGDRGLEIGGHAHGQGVQRKSVSAQLSRELRQ